MAIQRHRGVTVTSHSSYSAFMKMFFLLFFGTLFFSFIIPWDRFADPDAFYHANISQTVLESGPVSSFPWLDLTSLGSAFADHHYLLHVITAPFTAAFGMFRGLRIATVLLAAIFFSALFASLRWIGIRKPLLWASLAIATGPFLLRVLLGKATPLALTWFVLGLAAAWMRRPWIVAIAAFAFALSHGGWVYLLGAVILLAIGDLLFRIVAEERAWTDGLLWREVVFGFAGAAAGLIIHPNFPQNFRFLWTQIVTIGLQTPWEHVMLGSEWRPAPPSLIIAWLSLWIIVLLYAMLRLMSGGAVTTHRRAMHGAVAFALPVAGLLALTFNSRRSIEYLVPTLAFWVPHFFFLYQKTRFRSRVSQGGKGILGQGDVRRSSLLNRSVGMIVFVLIIYNIGGAYVALHDGKYRDDIFRDAIAPMSERLVEGDRIFHSDWDEFPILWSLEPRAKYVSGLDPTFLFVASSSLSDAYRDLTWLKTASSTIDEAWALIHDRVSARFVFIDKEDHEPLLNLIRSDARYRVLADTPDAASFEIQQ